MATLRVSQFCGGSIRLDVQLDILSTRDVVSGCYKELSMCSVGSEEENMMALELVLGLTGSRSSGIVKNRPRASTNSRNWTAYVNCRDIRVGSFIYPCCIAGL
jgi:hypothetical protein